MTSYDLTNKTAIITGGAGGIGAEIAREFARAGASIVIASRNIDALETLAGELRDNGAAAEAIAVDICDPAAVEALVTKTVSSLGRLDIIVNNAGGGSRMQAPEDTPYDEWVRLIDFNLTGTFNCCIAAGKQMLSQGAGNIINISSTAGTKGNPYMVHYSAAKAGVISLTNNLAFAWAPKGINVNCIAPGLIATPAMKSYPGVIPPETTEEGESVPPLTRPPGPEDVAAMARFLASPAAAMITGEVIPVRAWFKSDRFWQ